MHHPPPDKIQKGAVRTHKDKLKSSIGRLTNTYEKKTILANIQELLQLSYHDFKALVDKATALTSNSANQNIAKQEKMTKILTVGEIVSLKYAISLVNGDFRLITDYINRETGTAKITNKTLDEQNQSTPTTSIIDNIQARLDLSQKEYEKIEQVPISLPKILSTSQLKKLKEKEKEKITSI